MRTIARLLALVMLGACHSATEARPIDPIPAGATDPSWLVLDRTCSPDAPVEVLSAAQRATLPPFSHGSQRVSDDDWADAARVVPGGWGGSYLDHDTGTVFLVDPTKRDVALAALAARGLVPAPLGLATVRVRRGRWDFAQLADWFGFLRGHLPAMTATFSADIQETRNRLEYTVSNAADRAALEAAFRPLHLPCYLVAIYPSAR